MVKSHVQDLSAMGRPVTLAELAMKGWGRIQCAFGPRSPYRIGDSVVGDDPFNGRQEGVVVSQRGMSLCVKTVRGLFFYDHRHLRKLD